MNNEPGVRADTRAKVLQVIAELRYRPSQSARSLAGARSFLAESVVVDGDGNEIARGSGNFVTSKIKLTADIGYRI